MSTLKLIVIFTALTFLNFGQLPASAQQAGRSGSLAGRVTQKGAPVAGARVEATVHDPAGNKTTATTTDADGRYRLDDLKPGDYMVIAEGERGKGIAYRDSVKVGAGQNVALDLVLNMDDYKVFESTFRLSEIVQVAADLPQSIDEVSKTVNVIGADEMRERADITLVDSLRTIPGFRVQQLGGFGRTASIKTRGLRNQDTAMLIDGVRLRDAASITGDATPFLSDLTLTSVSRVEVLRGSGSSVYGTNAIGGVIDLVTPEPQPGPHGQVSFAAGGLGLARFRGNFSDTANGGRFGFNAAVSRTVYTKGIDGQDDAHNTNFQSKIDYRPWEETVVSGRFFVSDAYVRLNDSPDTFGVLPSTNRGIIDAVAGRTFVPDRNDPNSTQRSKFVNAQLVFNHVFNAKTVLQAWYSGLKTSRKNDDSFFTAGTRSGSASFFDGLIQTAHAHVDWSASENNRLVLGYEYENEKFGNRGESFPGGSLNFFTRAYQSSNTFYAQDLVSLLDGRLNLAGGVRAQIFGLSDPKFSTANAPYSNLTLDNPPTAYTFDGSAAYFFAKTNTKLRAHVGNGYRVPSLYERFGSFYSTFFNPPFVALGDPNLEPERSIAFDAGIEQLLGGRARLTAVYFYTRLIDTIGYGNVVRSIGSTARPFGGYENQKGGIARGGEFSATYSPVNSTSIFTSYTYTNSDQRSPQVSGSGVVRTLGIPEHQFTLVATQRIKRFWASFDFTGTSDYLAPIFSGSNFQTYVYRFRGQRRGDLTAGYNFTMRRDKLNLRVFGTVENVFDDEYYENGFRTPGRNGRIGVSFGF
ncbi:MAG: TonB-dependent receptor plug domain-containing protein [Pyrinomonadaceae bacterium]